MRFAPPRNVILACLAAAVVAVAVGLAGGRVVAESASQAGSPTSASLQAPAPSILAASFASGSAIGVDDAGRPPTKAECSKAYKLLTAFERLAQKKGKKLSPKKLKELRRKRDDGTITSEDLPGFLQREFPGVLEGFSLAALIKMCNYDKA